MTVEFDVRNPFEDRYEGHFIVVVGKYQEYEEFEGPSKVLILPGSNLI